MSGEVVIFNENMYCTMQIESFQQLQITPDPSDFIPLPCKGFEFCFSIINAVQSLWPQGRFETICV